MLTKWRGFGGMAAAGDFTHARATASQWGTVPVLHLGSGKKMVVARLGHLSTLDVSQVVLTHYKTLLVTHVDTFTLAGSSFESHNPNQAPLLDIHQCWVSIQWAHTLLFCLIFSRLQCCSYLWPHQDLSHAGSVTLLQEQGPIAWLP